MTTYQQYQEEIARLRRLADAARQVDIARAREQILDIMRAHGLQAADLDVGMPSSGTRRRRPTVQYRNAAGEIWHGLGRMPKWLAGKNKADYLVR
ncbi:H-NS histone family protein [Pseudoduganella violacea]|uniref:DNA-binding protein H-NS n=1 Tax=Pseudoduganella violacea TaxID=1715466 RepID=A0A7W5BEY0_9BURK|nr:H-NS histone family protein [Pseudoduganella violacea]MBB3121728.1 DNA-binding protein H-NS [Pseudoduganella violacea]